MSPEQAREREPRDPERRGDGSEQPHPRRTAILRSRRLRRLLSAVVSLAVLAGLVIAGVASINLAALGHALATVNGLWLAVAFALMVGAFLARGESWFVVIGAALPEARIGRPAVTRALLIGMAASAVAPGRVGEAVRAWAIARRLPRPREHVATVAGTLVAQTLMNLLALALLSIVALIGGGVAKGRPEALVAVIALPIAIVLLAVLAPPAVERLARRPGGRGRSGLQWLSRQLTEAHHGLFAFSHPRELAHSLTAQLGAWALQLGCCYATLRAFDLHVRGEVAAAAGVLVATNLTAIVPLTPSNVGVFQAACIAVLAGFKVHSSEALAFGFVLQAIEVVAALLLGGASLMREGPILGLRDHSRHDSGPPPPAAAA
ncbi:MAG: lysylphosphatidylglycerol synthase transmembrane domain-containing protein [Solirubrobacteraceae bacterium]